MRLHEDGKCEIFVCEIYDRRGVVLLSFRLWMAQPGDLLLFAADKNKVVWDVLGNLRLEIARRA